ncbi:MAG: site-specific recombinase [Patescibacteria group bacterium]|nr:site-specific recombinase [Patescibacteria group bacterium]
MKDKAIALRRISDRKQDDGHSLIAQKESTERTAEQLGLLLVKTWDEIRSSKRGKNFKRRDMEQMLKFCKQNRDVKYLLIDFVNRLMREVEILIYYKVLFNQMGVELYFCDPTQQHLNGGDQYSKLMLLLEAYKAETDNDSRAETTIARMKARYNAGYYISHPHQGYMKSDIAGLHVKDPERFGLLQKSGYLIIYEQYTPEQAVRWLSDHGYRTRGGKKMDVNHYIELIQDRYFCGIIDIKKEGPLSDIKNVKGLHEPMFSVHEHEKLVAIITKRNPRIRQKHNPEYPVANLIRHLECKHEELHSKFSGFAKDRGIRNGKKRPKCPTYRCRTCRREFSRQRLHDGIETHMNSLEFLPDSATFKRALIKVWRNQRGSVIQRISILEANKARIETDIIKTAADYAKEPEGAAKNALRLLLEDYEAKLENIKNDITTTQNVDMESEDFVKFAMNFTEELKEKWWSISFDERQGGEQILFNGEFYVDNSAKVHTPKLSTIYTLGTNKNDPNGVDFNKMVELVGTAPTSIGFKHSTLQAYLVLESLNTII